MHGISVCSSFAYIDLGTQMFQVNLYSMEALAYTTIQHVGYW